MTAEHDLSRLQAFDDLIARVWHDPRMTPGTRDLIFAMAWALERDTDRPAGGEFWNKVRALLGRDERGRHRLRYLIAADAPRYESPNTWHTATCEAPRLRVREEPDAVTTVRCAYPHHPHLGACRQVTRTGPADARPTWKPAPAGAVCGANANPELHVIEHDPRTGWRIDHWFCTRHKDHAGRVRAQVEAAGPAPEPIPTTGGLLPCYFKADFERLYRDGTQRLHLQWEPPVYGLCADDWPLPGRDSALPRRAGLRLVVSELADA